LPRAYQNINEFRPVCDQGWHRVLGLLSVLAFFNLDIQYTLQHELLQVYLKLPWPFLHRISTDPVYDP
jgi:hypothetical protein